MKPNGTPIVSIVVPTYNCAQFIGIAIESVLSQDVPGVEVVVGDDGEQRRLALGR